MEPVTYLERLRELALDQHGLVTTDQARGEGVPAVELRKLFARGRLERAARGVYRVPQVPPSENDQYHLAVLWTGDPGACLSHESALEAWGVTDIMPNQIHVCVPRARRIRRSGGHGYVVHHEDLLTGQKTWWEGIPITTVPATIEQCIVMGTPSYLIEQALERAGRTNLLLPQDVDHLVHRLGERDHVA